MKSFLPFLSILFAALVPAGAAPEIPATNLPEKCYVFSYFTGNGEDGLHLAWSTDGLKWEALKSGGSFLTPTVGKSKLMRDPCVTQGPDGTFHMVWTDSWDSDTIGYASSKDLIHWSEQKDVPVMAGESNVKNCWAPEIIYDAKAKRFMIFWATTIPGRFPLTEFGGKNDSNHRIYATTTTDFETYSKSIVFFDPGFNCIDSTILPVDGRAYMFFKDETKVPKAMKNLRLAVASNIAGPYEVEKKPLNEPGAWVEGPTALQVGDETYLYFDAYTQHHYAAMVSKDLKTWRDVTSKLKMPSGVRHGTAFAVSSAVMKTLLEEKR
ncbi:MAG: glycoside hydrolase family 43 protein [Luteolibacter sp.]